ncbi:MAG TPA: response regulator, partial [Longimicrobiaceae bacterium]|nr:response regulator [Longimicrobiaceae bacterium]
MLVTEDDESVYRFIVAVLERDGCVVEVAQSGPEALKALERELFDIVLLDVNLPGIGGLDVLAVGRTLQTDAEFVMVTGDGSIGTAVEAMKLGAFDYISKPIGVD